MTDSKPETARPRVRLLDPPWARGLTGTDEGRTFSGDYHHIRIDGNRHTTAFRPEEFERLEVAS